MNARNASSIRTPDRVVVRDLTTYYKVLIDGKSCHGGSLEWSLPTQDADGTWMPGAWHEVEGEIVVCANGLHLTTRPYGAWMERNATVYEAEGAGESDSEGDDKIAFQRARLLRPAPEPEWWVAAQKVVASIKDVPFLQPDGDPDPAWRLFTAPTWVAARADARAAAWNAAEADAEAAAGDAAWDAGRDAAWDAGRNAAGNAGRDAAGDAAEAAARDDAEATAGDAAWADAQVVAWDAAWNARLNVMMAIASDLDVPPQHRDHAAARWRVWLKGYALFCDVDGVLYVYAKEGA